MSKGFSILITSEKRIHEAVYQTTESGFHVNKQGVVTA